MKDENPLLNDLKGLLGHQPTEPTTRSDADRIIHHISALKGKIPEELTVEFGKTSEKAQNFVVALIERVKRQEEKYIKDVAEGLYSQNARILYELIQNADDAKYLGSSPFLRSDPPHLTFTLEPGKLVVTTNESGFTLSDVLAICSAGESSKRSRDDGSAIGEKGIGFKSVFTISRLVTIESGFWGFVFKYDRSSPLSMITPSPTANKEPVPGTKITLALGSKQENLIFDELQSLPSEAIVFLRQIKVMTIHLRGTSFSHIQSSERKIQKFLDRDTREVASSVDNAVILRLELEHKTGSAISRQDQIRFRLFKKTHGNMPDEPKRPGIRESEIQLAFPIDNEQGLPNISEEGEYVFAFLPVSKQEHLPFLIHGDFLTTMSREDLVARAGNEWNDKLFDCVIDTFLSAVKQFVHGGIFTVEWLHYLIRRPLTTFWAPFHRRLLRELPQEAIFMDESESTWVRASNVKILPTFFRLNGRPLLRDIVRPSIYLSNRYAAYQVEHLLPLLGVKVLSWKEILDRLAADLGQGSESLTKTADLPGERFEQFMELLEEMIMAFADDFNGTGDRTTDQSLSPPRLTEHGRRTCKEQLRHLPFIPLQRGQWLSPSRTIYFPTLEDQEIPTNIDLKLLNSQVSKSFQHRALYQALGVSDCSPEEVCQKIVQYHVNEPDYHHNWDRNNLILHFRFLHQFWGTLSDREYRLLRAVTSRGSLSRARKMLYFPSEHKYHTQKLVEAIPSQALESAGIDTDVMLHTKYFHKPPTSLFFGQSWMQWLEASPFLNHYPPLSTDEEPQQMSEILRLVLSTDSRLFLGVLRSHWQESYQARVSEHPILMSDIGQAEVQCSNGSSTSLSLTYYPNNKLRSKAENLCVNARFPFLGMPSDLWNEEAETERTREDEWSLLQKFGVSFEITVNFYLTALDCLQEETRLNSRRLLEAASSIYVDLRGLANPKQKDLIQSVFDQNELILEDGQSRIWKKPKDCIWSGPSILDHCKPLEDQYRGSDEVKKFFVRFLDIRNATYKDIHRQILAWKPSTARPDVGEGKKWQNASQMFAEAYSHMSNLVQQEEQDELRALMESDQLIFANDSWLRLSQCIWKSEVDIAGKTEIGDLYPSLKGFFVEFLGIETADAPVLVKAWISAVAVREPDFIQIKGYMRQISNLIAADDLKDKDEFEKLVKTLKKKKCIPIRQAVAHEATTGNPQNHAVVSNLQNMQLVKSDEEYYVIDNHRYGNLLSGRIPVMACTHEETGQLEPLLKYLSVWEKRLTNNVTETSAAVENFQLHEAMTDYFRSRSFAFAWCAAKFFSRKYVSQNASAYRRLQNMEIYTSPELNTKIEITVADEDVISVPSDRVRAEVQDVDPDSIKIIFPEDNQARDACFRTQLPLEMISLLGIIDSKPEKTLSLLLFQPMARLLQILQEEDIPPLSWVPAPDLPEDASETPLLQTVDPTFASHLPFRPSVSLGTPIGFAGHRDNSGFGGHGGGSGFGGHGGVASQSFASFGSGRQSFGGVSSPFVADDDDGYVQLLRQLLNAAQGILTNSGVNISAISAFGSDRRSEASRAKVGAAGEMFIFETLRRLELQEFSLENWKSKVRHNVNVLEAFSGLSPCSGEDQDIVYKDCTGQMEAWLRQKSYNDFPRLHASASNPIRYIIEIKTTIHDAQERMLMSSAQYDTMRTYSLANQIPSPRTVFVLIRVSNLLARRPRSIVIVDPAGEQGRALTFQPETWAVRFVGGEAGRNRQAVADNGSEDEDEEL